MVIVVALSLLLSGCTFHQLTDEQVAQINANAKHKVRMQDGRYGTIKGDTIYMYDGTYGRVK